MAIWESQFHAFLGKFYWQKRKTRHKNYRDLSIWQLQIFDEVVWISLYTFLTAYLFQKLLMFLGSSIFDVLPIFFPFREHGFFDTILLGTSMSLKELILASYLVLYLNSFVYAFLVAWPLQFADFFVSLFAVFKLRRIS